MRLLLVQGVDLEDMLPYFTSNVATLLRLPGKGAIALGLDADLLVLDADLRVQHLMARGNWHIKHGELQQAGRFEA
jgi:beta-aspartyl-dipeptidase (metallo-type)